jgi:hypothetical protein
MPFRAMPQDGALSPDDLNFLQEVYDAAALTVSSVDDHVIGDVVRTLITYYQMGERDRDKLVAMAIKDLQRAAG